MKNRPNLLLMLCSATSLTSCATKTVVVNRDNGIVRLGNDVTGHVYTWNAETKQWELSKNKVTLPEGWFATEFHGQ